MKKTLLNEEKEEEEGNVVPFSIVTGGKDDNRDWLEKLPRGSVFICKAKGMNQLALEEYHVVYTIRNPKVLKDTKGLQETLRPKEVYYLLLYNLNEPEVYLWVNTKEFSKVFDFIFLLKEGKEEQWEE